MELCSNRHDEVCFEGKYCPACGIAEELKEANDEIAKLQQQIESLEQ
jgi:hypothetical protein